MGQLAGTLFSPKGTIDKRDFWIGFAVALGFLVLSGAVDGATEGASNRIGGLLLALVLQLAGLVIWFMIAIKRCRTLGQSPWLSLLLFIPVVGLIWLIVIGAQNAPGGGKADVVAANGPVPASVLHIAGLPVALAAVAALVMTALALHVCVGVITRYGVGAPVQLFAPATFEMVATYGFIVVFACGALVFLAIDRHRNTRAQRTGLWLALPLGLVLAALALVGLGSFVGFARLPALAWSLLRSPLTSDAFSGVAMLMFALSVLARTPRMAACLVLPVVLVPLAAVTVEASIVRAALWMVLPIAGLGGVGLVTGLATSRCEEAVWLAIGAGIAVAYAILLSPGLFTPTELSALTFAGALLVLGILGLGGEPRRLAAGLVTATGNVAALIAATVASIALSQLWSFSGAGAALAKTIVQANVLSQNSTAMLVPVALALVAALIAFTATSLIALAMLPLVFAALSSLGIGNEVILPAVVLGALAGFIMRLYTSAPSADGDTRPAGLIILAGLALVLGCAAYFLAPIGTFLVQLLLY